MGELVELSGPAGVEFDDHALAMLTRMAGALAGTAAIMRLSEDRESLQRGLDIIDDLFPHGDVIAEHIEVLERYAEDILRALNEDEESYFSNESKIQHLTVMSIIKNKCKTIRVQRFFVSRIGCRVLQDNDKIALECHDGALACGIKSDVTVNTRIRMKKAR